ncbi:MAG: EAL domain-containing protein [Eubacteriales bacterium]|nr:EAL domain-containing protein [Eubacteriales bacterium]
MVKEVYSVLLLLTCSLTVAGCFYAVRGDYRPLLNRLLLLIGCAVVIWAACLALIGAAQEERVSQLARRIAPLGWGVISAVTVHLMLALTGNRLLKKRWIPALIYLPSVVILFAFSVLPLFGLNPDMPVRMEYGWIAAAPTDGWDVFFYLYTVTYILISILLLLRWGKRSGSFNIKRQAKLIAYSLIINAALSVATDIVPPILRIPFPQVSAVFMSIQILAICFCVDRYHFLQPDTVSEEEKILSTATRGYVYRYFGLGLMVAGGALFFVRPLLAGGFAGLPAGLVASAVVAGGAFLLVLDRLPGNEKFKELLVSGSVALLVPLVVLWFADGGVFVTWALIFPLMVICLLFNRRIMLISLISASFLTQLFQWAYLPAAAIRLSGVDYGFRLGIIALGAVIAFYVNKAYTGRLKENISHLEMQAIAAEISQSFVSISEDNIGEKLYAALERCGRFFRCDRAYLVLVHMETYEVRYAVEWTSETADPGSNTLDEAMRSIRPDMFKRLRTSNVLLLKDTLLLPPPAAKIKRRMLSQGIRALANAAVRNADGELIGFLGFNACRPMREWEPGSPGFIEIAAGILSDAVATVDSERELNRMAYYDQLTGLPNRILFRNRLGQAIAAAEDTDKMIGVAFLDLDGFKFVNDTLGHDQGDKLLVEVARTLCGAVRGGDVVARFGGDEFVLLLQISSQDELRRIMDRLMASTRKPVVLAGQAFYVSVSAGVALYPQDGTDADTLLKNADAAMYAAKDAGKSRYLLCSKDIKEEILEKVELTQLLYRALEQGQLTLHFQPQIDMGSNFIVGLEALLRWNLPGRGMIGPAVFIPIAEQTGLIQVIGDWVLREACALNKRWLDMGCTGLRMAVNVSVHQLNNPSFVQRVEGVLKATGLPAQNLELEITESVANSNADNMVTLLHRLKALGVTISIDDFGTKYSSLSRLKLLPIDRIKMDMQFVHGIEKDDKDKAISKVIINLAKSLRLKVIAEGVETAPQLNFLHQRMCDEVQGYYYYKPMPAAQTEEVLLQQLERRGNGWLPPGGRGPGPGEG